MPYPDNPHFALPLRLNGSSFAVVEQDSETEIIQAAMAVLRTEPGTRDEMPEFGFPDQTFRQGGVAGDRLREAVERWEPRYVPEIESHFERLMNLVSIRPRRKP